MPKEFKVQQDASLHELAQDDEFVMYACKCLDCPKKFKHDWTECPYAHQGEKARRRDPRLHNYESSMCPEMESSGACPRGDACPYSHNVFESYLHPERYRTVLCSSGSSCTRKLCFFAHNIQQLRQPPRAAQASAADSAAASTSAAASSLQQTVAATGSSNTESSMQHQQHDPSSSGGSSNSTEQAPEVPAAGPSGPAADLAGVATAGASKANVQHGAAVLRDVLSDEEDVLMLQQIADALQHVGFSSSEHQCSTAAAAAVGPPSGLPTSEAAHTPGASAAVQSTETADSKSRSEGSSRGGSPHVTRLPEIVSMPQPPWLSKQKQQQHQQTLDGGEPGERKQQEMYQPRHQRHHQPQLQQYCREQHHKHPIEQEQQRESQLNHQQQQQRDNARLSFDALVLQSEQLQQSHPSPHRMIPQATTGRFSAQHNGQAGGQHRLSIGSRSDAAHLSSVLTSQHVNVLSPMFDQHPAAAITHSTGGLQGPGQKVLQLAPSSHGFSSCVVQQYGQQEAQQQQQCQVSTGAAGHHSARNISSFGLAEGPTGILILPQAAAVPSSSSSSCLLASNTFGFLQHPDVPIGLLGPYQSCVSPSNLAPVAQGKSPEPPGQKAYVYVGGVMYQGNTSSSLPLLRIHDQSDICSSHQAAAVLAGFPAARATTAAGAAVTVRGSQQDQLMLMQLADSSTQMRPIYSIPTPAGTQCQVGTATPLYSIQTAEGSALGSGLGLAQPSTVLQDSSYLVAGSTGQQLAWHNHLP